MPKNNFGPELSGHSLEETMSKSELEQYFTAVQTDLFNFKEEVNQRFEVVDKRFDDLENRMDNGFKRLESLCFAILEIVREHDSKFLNFEKRLVSMERKLV